MSIQLKYQQDNPGVIRDRLRHKAIHKERLRRIRVNASKRLPPIDHLDPGHIRAKSFSTRQAEKQSSIEKENGHLLKKIMKITQGGSKNYSKFKPDQGPRSLNIINRQRELLRIKLANDRIASKLLNQSASIVTKTLAEEYEQVKKSKMQLARSQRRGLIVSPSNLSSIMMPKVSRTPGPQCPEPIKLSKIPLAPMFSEIDETPENQKKFRNKDAFRI